MKKAAEHLPTILKDLETKYCKEKKKKKVKKNSQQPVIKLTSNVEGLTPRYKYFIEKKKFKSNVKPIQFFDGIDISNKYYFKLNGKEYQKILCHGIHGNGKSFALQYFSEKYSIHHKVKCIYIQMRKIINDLYALDFAGKNHYINRLTNDYELICIDEIEKFNVTENNDLNIFGIFDDGINNMKKFAFGSNMNRKELRGRLGDKIMSRVEGECLIVENKEVVLR